MAEQKEGILEKIERSLGLPSLTKVSETLQRFPDKAQLTLIKEVLEVAERLSKNAVELEKVIMLVKEVNVLSPEKLESLEKVLKRVEKIVKEAPSELMDFLASLKT